MQMDLNLEFNSFLTFIHNAEIIGSNMSSILNLQCLNKIYDKQTKNTDKNVSHPWISYITQLCS